MLIVRYLQSLQLFGLKAFSIHSRLSSKILQLEVQFFGCNYYFWNVKQNIKHEPIYFKELLRRYKLCNCVSINGFAMVIRIFSLRRRLFIFAYYYRVGTAYNGYI